VLATFTDIPGAVLGKAALGITALQPPRITSSGSLRPLAQMVCGTSEAVGVIARRVASGSFARSRVELTERLRARATGQVFADGDRLRPCSIEPVYSRPR
jgi:hypothetical protein